MAEQFKKVYIPATEFVRAWEKEVYELTNLDYFIYLLMNSVADILEHDFFPNQHNVNEEFLLDKDEITSLSFLIGDSVQLFFEKNCFGVCPLNCPIQLNKKISTDELLSMGRLPENLQLGTRSCSNKEDCLKYDLLNFVLIDAIIDFYHFDLRLTADEGDAFLQDLIHFINNHIINLIKNEGHNFLLYPQENASALFENLLSSEDNEWNEFDPWDESDFDPDEPDELWKLPSADLFTAIEEFKALQNTANLQSLTTLELFGKFITAYIGALSVEDLTRDDLEEFLSVVLPTELASEDGIDFTKEMQTFKSFLNFVDYQYETNLVRTFEELNSDDTLKDLLRTFAITQKFHKMHSYVEFQISPARNDPSLIEGFFEVTGMQGSRYFVEDIHLNDKYLVDLSALNTDDIHAGDIFNMSLVADQDGWHAAWVECVFPRKSKFYLL